MENKLFEDLVDSMAEMVAIEKGEVVPPPENIHRHEPPDSESCSPRCGNSGH